jgi:hypothetical protein
MDRMVHKEFLSNFRLSLVGSSASMNALGPWWKLLESIFSFRACHAVVKVLILNHHWRMETKEGSANAEE